MQRTKGYLGEREIVHLLEELGVHAKRVPLSGATSFQKDDVILEDGSTIEVKRRKKIPAILKEMLVSADYGAIREDRGEWLIVMGLKEFAKLLKIKKVCEMKTQKMGEVPIYPTCAEVQHFADKLRGLVMLKTTKEMLKQESIKECLVTYTTPDGKEHKEKFKVQENGFVPILKECQVTNVEEVKNG